MDRPIAYDKLAREDRFVRMRARDIAEARVEQGLPPFPDLASRESMRERVHGILVGELQAVIGREAREQILAAEGRLPDAVIACVGGGSNAIGLFAGFVDDAGVRLIGVEAAGAASLGTGRAGVLHGARSSLLADEDGQIADAHSISAGLDYPGVGPEHAFLRDTGRAEYVSATDEEALAAFHLLAAREGIIPALEPAHALARALELDAELVLVGLSGRGDKDLATVLSR